MLLRIIGILLSINLLASSAPDFSAQGTKESPLEDVSLEDVGMQGQLGESCRQGESIEDCTQVCTCVGGSKVCRPRCLSPLVSSSVPPEDSACHLKPSDDHCCSTLVCTSGLEKDENKICIYKNETYRHGESFNDSCTATCLCQMNGQVTCKPRCPPTNRTGPSDSCLSIKDTKDPCCTVLYCDVNSSDDNGSHHRLAQMNIISVVPLNSSSVMLNLNQGNEGQKFTAETSNDQMTWSAAELKGTVVHNLSPGQTYFFRIIHEGIHSNVVSAFLPNMNNNTFTCEFKGNKYKRGDEFHDGCAAYCECRATGVECATIECPTDFGLDVLDPHCLEWETQPLDFIPTPPNCCPDTVHCKNNGSCIYEGQMFENWSDIPESLSGCEKKCYCETGSVSCKARCSPVPAEPPSQLSPLCSPSMPILTHPPDDNCCLHWVCPTSAITNTQSHPGFPPHSHNPNGISVQTLEAIDENTVRLVFSVPPVLVRLHGRVELRYTSDNKNSDPSTWDQQVLVPPNDLIATPELEFELGGLQPDTEYKIKITVVMRDLHNSPASQVLVVKTPRANVTTTLPPVIALEPDLHVSQLNSTWATLVWRKFSSFELQFIDGVQLRYKEINGKVYQATPLIHRAVTSYTIEDLQPESQYEVGIFFIPFPGQTTELQAYKTLQISTTMENDPYRFELMLDIHHIKSASAEVTWSGVPYPEDRYVNIFRIIYQSEEGREDMNNFKVAKRDSPASTLIQDLKPDTRYRLWMEAYLRNGRTKKSNVKDFTTRVGQPTTDTIHQGKQEGMPLIEASDYYGPLVGVSILAVIAILSVVALLLLLARKHGHNKAPITAAVHRKAPHTAAYDNPSYKTCEGDISNGGRTVALEDT